MASFDLLDDEQLRTMLSEVLKRAGHEVQTACDGDEAIKMYGRNPTDLVITDPIMPDKGGLEMIREIRRDFPTVRIIANVGRGSQRPGKLLSVSREVARKAGSL